MTLDPQRAKSIFLAALERSAEERGVFLDEACAADTDLRRCVERLLAAHDRPDSMPEAPATKVPTAVPKTRPGAVLGSYKLLEEIGEGGMGTVWMAQQLEPVKRLVAVKLIKVGMDSKAVLARFEAERQALALMDHPNIAKVHDAGTTTEGRPFFVMELVKGVPITRFCDERRLTPRQRLELFVPVCQAIQHAHQKGIIHRDVKPSNVLVTLYDDKPVPKVIDFGVAKATGQQLTEATLHTGFGAVVGTIEYMSPEQASFNALDVDTRSDIYSLGVLLYELLTGSPPFSRKELEKAGMLETLRVIREQEPTKPSTKLSTSEGLPTLAANRGTDPKRLAALVRGELDWIVMKALEKDRNRRYETANSFVADVRRYLNDEPVQACPPSASYRLRKFVRRNRGPVLAASVILVLLLGGTIGTMIGFVRARAERDEKELAREDAVAAAAAEKQAREAEADQRAEAEAVSRYMVEALRKPDPALDGSQLKVVDLLDQAAAKLDREFAGSSKIKGALLSALGQTYLGLGLPAKAIPMFEKARNVLGAAFGIDHADTLTAMFGLAGAIQSDGRRTEALTLHEETLKRRKATLGMDDTATLLSMEAVARALLLVGRGEEAIPLHEESLARLKARLGPEHPYTLGAMGDLGLAYQNTARYAKALTLAEETLKLRQAKFPDHPETFIAMSNLAYTYLAVGQRDKALPLYEATLKLRKEKLGPNHSDTLGSMRMLAGALVGTERQAEALSLYEDAIKGLSIVLRAGHPRTLSAMHELASAYAAAGRVPDALLLCEKTLELRKVWLPPDHTDTVGTMALLSFIQLKAKEFAKAEPVLRECLAIREKKYPDQWTTFNTRSMLGASLLGQKKFADAETHLLLGYEGMKARERQILAQAKQRLTEALERLVQLYDDWGKKDKALEWRKKLEAHKKDVALRIQGSDKKPRPD